ncbi:MAG: Hsp20/alpha crystallin family protein [Phycisphaerae bacterium]|nr:Hsp20/alpha crystallin family protein [Phycisphaerae bacterium]
MLAIRRSPNGGSLGWPTGVELAEGLHRDFDRLIGRVLGDPADQQCTAFRVDAHEDENHVYVEMELPGLTKDDVDITLEDGVLTVTGEKKAAADQEKRNYHLRERRYGKFVRSFSIPGAVDEDKVAATLRDGILTITLDKREEVKPRKIPVKVG